MRRDGTEMGRFDLHFLCRAEDNRNRETLIHTMGYMVKRFIICCEIAQLGQLYVHTGLYSLVCVYLDFKGIK